MNNINANLNLPSIPTNQSLEVNEDLIELDDTNNDLDENFEIASSSKNHNRKRSNSKKKYKNKVELSDGNEKIYHNNNENQLKKNIMNNPIVQNSNSKANRNMNQKNQVDIDPNSTQNQPSTPFHANYTHHQINNNYSPKQIPLPDDYANSPDYYYNLSPANDPNNEILFSNLSTNRSRTPSPSRSNRSLPVEINYKPEFQPNLLPYSNSPTSDSPIILYDLEDNEYSELPPRRIISSAENNIAGPPPTASSTYKENEYNSRPVSHRINSNLNPYYFNQDLPNGNNGSDDPGYSSYQSPSLYDNSQNQIYMNNLVIPFQKPKVCVREAPIMKKKNNYK